VGILEDTYLWAVPFPGLLGGNRRAMMEVDLGITVVSSAYSRNRCQTEVSMKDKVTSLPSLVSSL